MINSNNRARGIFSASEGYRMVWHLGWAAILINLVMAVIKAVTGQLTTQNAGFYALFIVSLLAIMILIRRQYKFGVEWFLVTIESLTPMIIYGYGTTRTPAVSIYIMVIIIMGLLDSRRGILLSTVVSTFSLGAVSYALYGNEMFSGQVITDLFNQVLIFFFTALLGFVVDSVFNSSKFELYKFKNLVNQSPLSMVIFDIAGKVMYVNDAFTQATGFSADEAMEFSAHEFTASTLTKDQYDEFWRTIRAGGTWEGEIISTTKAGKSYHEKLIVHPIFDDQGKVVYFSSISENIDAKKTAAIALQYAHTEMLEKLDEIIALKNKLQDESIHDSMTGLYNRRFFNEVIHREISRAERDKSSLSLIVFDIDYFKSVNDTYGHVAGDEILRELAKFLTGNIRKMDIVCRYGGEEFVIVLPGASAKDAAQRANSLRSGIASADIQIKDTQIRLTCSFGICSFPDLADDVDQLLSRADIAMYTAKQAGRDSCVVWSDDLTLNSLMVKN